MSAVALMRRAIARARTAGITVIETPGWEERGNGLAGYVSGGPIGNVDHHLVAQLRTDEDYIQRCVQLCIDGHATLDGPLCSVMTDPLGRIWVIAGLPANHAGRGSSAVRERVRAGQPPGRPGPDDYTGNAWYTGNEAQHPGDSTPWPGAQVNAMAVWDAALAVEAGWTENSAIQHLEHSLRKIDCSYATGPTPGATHRQRVAAWIKIMTGQAPASTPDEDDELNQDQANKLDAIYRALFSDDPQGSWLAARARSADLTGQQNAEKLDEIRNVLYAEDVPGSWLVARARSADLVGQQNAERIAAIQAGGIYWPGAQYLALPALANAIREDDGEKVEIDEAELARQLAPLLAGQITAISDVDLERIARASADELARRVTQ